MRIDTPPSPGIDLGDDCHFEFDEWADLARRDAQAFEERRVRCIESFIRQAPLEHQRRLRGLQFRIDLERVRARTPLGACVRLSTLMWSSLAGEGGLRERLGQLLDAMSGHPPESVCIRPSAQIIPFPGPINHKN